METEASNIKSGKYNAETYFSMLRLANRSEITIKNYRKILKSYADFLKVPLDEVHQHLSVVELLKYAASRKKFSPAGTKTQLTVLNRFFKVNGIAFDELEANAMKPKINLEQNDSPLERESIQKMMDLTDAHGRAVISFLVSTGIRASELCGLLLSDVNGDVVTIRNEITAGAGGEAYLSTEAREYLDVWLLDRDNYIKTNGLRGLGLEHIKKPKKGEADNRMDIVLAKNDQRLFCTSYTSLHKKISRLFDLIGTAQGKYHRKNHIHSFRKFFRTNASRGMHVDLVETIMRHKGLMGIYVNIPTEQKKKEFHSGESVLYITRVEQRRIEKIEKENEALKASPENIEAVREEFKEMMRVQKLQYQNEMARLIQEATRERDEHDGHKEYDTELGKMTPAQSRENDEMIAEGRKSTEAIMKKKPAKTAHAKS